MASVKQQAFTLRIAMVHILLERSVNYLLTGIMENLFHFPLSVICFFRFVQRIFSRFSVRFVQRIFYVWCSVYFTFCVAYTFCFVQRIFSVLCSVYFLFCAAYIFRFVQRIFSVLCSVYFPFCAENIFSFLCREHTFFLCS